MNVNIEGLKVIRTTMNSYPIITVSKVGGSRQTCKKSTNEEGAQGVSELLHEFVSHAILIGKISEKYCLTERMSLICVDLVSYHQSIPLPG